MQVVCGALELTTVNEMSRDVSITQDVVVNYQITSIFESDIELTFTHIDGSEETILTSPGTYSINLGKIESIGVKTFKISAKYNEVESNTLLFNFIVTNTSTMFMSSTFEGGEFRNDQPVSINYRLSLLGARQFLTDVYIDNVLREAGVESTLGHNFYSITDLGLGAHTVTFKSKTLESINPVTAELTVPEFIIVAAEGRSYQFTRESLVMSLDARKGKSNNQSPAIREVWEDTEPGYMARTKLVNFAFNHINGWVPNSSEDPAVEGLTFAGKAYAEIDLQPLSSDISEGLTIEIHFSSTDTGNRVEGVKNVVLDLLQGDKKTGKGFLIDVKESFIRSSYADSLNSMYNNAEDVHMTVVINRLENEMLLYTNGAISGYSKIDPAANFLTSKKIILGARQDGSSIIDNANCKIKTFRVYNRALNDLEVFKNSVSDLTIEQQDAIIDLHEGQSVIPTLKLKFNEGVLDSATSITPVDIEYTDPSDPSKNIILYNSMIKKQGTTSLTYPVSNYTMNLYDAGVPYDYAPKDDWVPENIFTLKADYMDSSHANNTGIARYAASMFKRLGIKSQSQMIDERTKTTIDGFMVTLYVNGVNRGLYNFNTDRYGAKNYGLTLPLFKNTAVSYECASNSGVGTGFHTTDWDKIRGAFKVRYFKGEQDINKYMTFDPDSQQMVMTQGVHNELEDIIRWIYECSITEGKFYAEYEEHFDKDFLIYYLLIVEIFGLMDNLEKNMTLTYFGEEYDPSTGGVLKKWIPVLYDLDSSVGLSNNGDLKYQACVNFSQEDSMPADHQYNGTTSALWTCVKKYCKQELKSAYAELRRLGILNLESLMEHYQGETIDKVSPYFYSNDARLKYIAPSVEGSEKDTYYSFCKGRRIEYTRRWMSERITFLDSIYEYGNENNPDGDYWKYIQARYLKADPNATEFVISVKAASPLFLTTVDDSMQPHGKKYFVSDDKFYDITVPINNATDGAMFGITFGPKLLDIRYSEAIRLTSMFLEHGKSLIELNLPNNKDITEIVLNNCENLQYFDVSGCSKLGSVTGKENLKFDNCPNLRFIDFSATQVGGFTTHPDGGILEILNCNNSRIANFVLNKQHYIDELSIVNCNLLKKVEIVKCNKITDIDFPASVIDIFRVLDCPTISTITCKNTPYLNSLVDPTDPEGRTNFLIDNCPSLTHIYMSGLNNKYMTFLDLINVENIQSLDMSGCGYLGEIRISEAATNLTTFKCNNSYIKNIKLGRAGISHDYLDLGIFTNLQIVNFDNCRNLREIRNSNIGRSVAAQGSGLFRNCDKLIRISGYLRLTGSGTQTFYNCKLLVQLPATLDLSGMTSCSQFMSGCVKINMTEAKRIMSKLINLSGSTWRMFSSCIGIITNESSPFPANFFQYNPKITSLDQTFSGCSGMTGEFPNTLLYSLVNLTSFTYPFTGCNFEVPIYQSDVIFSKNTKLYRLNRPFAGLNLLRMPDKRLLENCPDLIYAYSLFNGQTTMTKTVGIGNYFIDIDYFINNPKLKDITHGFYNCRMLTGTIPEGLFRNQPSLEVVINLLYKCVGISGRIPNEMFATYLVNGVIKSKLKYVSGIFRDCPSLEGNIPDSIFELHSSLIDMSYAFAGGTMLGTNLNVGELERFPNRLFRNKPALSTVEGIFQNDINLRGTFDAYNQDDMDMFKEAVNLTSIAYLFDNCREIYGSIPEDLFNRKSIDGEYIPNKISKADGVFRHCEGITGRIPQNLFKSFFEVQSLDEFFSHCRGIEGGIPYSLFYNCVKLNSLRSFIVFPWDGSPRKFGTNRDEVEERCIDEETGLVYAFNKDLFLYNSRLEDLTHFLYSVGGQFGGLLPQTIFVGNRDLKFVSGMFCNTGVGGEVTRTLFASTPKITLMDMMFWRSGRITAITSDCIRGDYHMYVHRNSSGQVVQKSFAGMFSGQSLMTGEVPELWNEFPDAGSTVGQAGGVYKDCLAVDNYEDIPPTWK